jgi:hypothetical protein
MDYWPGMAYVFALARFSTSPLYVLDEIDAALDEHNQVRIILHHTDRSGVELTLDFSAGRSRACSRVLQPQPSDLYLPPRGIPRTSFSTD